MLALTCPVETPLHRVPVGAKLLGLALFVLIITQLKAPALAWLAVLLVGVLHMALGVQILLFSISLLRPLLPFLLIIALWHAYTGTLAQGSTTGARMIAAVALANLITMTSRLSDIVALLERSLAIFNRTLQARRLALAIALVIRFTPVLRDKSDLLADAWRARRNTQPRWQILPPLALAAIDDAERVAEALSARGGV